MPDLPSIRKFLVAAAAAATVAATVATDLSSVLTYIAAGIGAVGVHQIPND